MINFNSFPVALNFIQGSSYFLIFLLMVFEGPIITAAAAFASSMGIFSIYLIFALSFLGNVVGDVFYFSLGKLGQNRLVSWNLKHLDLNKNGIEKIKSTSEKKPFITLLIIKLVPNLGGPGLILAGATNMKFKKFIFFSALISFFYSLFFSIAGFYLGSTLGDIIYYSNYAGWIVLLLIVLFLIITIIYQKIMKELYKRNLQKSWKV